MGPVLWAGVGALAVLLLWGIVAHLGGGRRDSSTQRRAEVLAELVRIVDVLPFAAMLVGRHDEVMRMNAQAEAMGLGRGTRVGFADLLDEVRRSRSGQRVFAGVLARQREAAEEALELQVNVIPLGDEQVLVVAQDDSEARRVEAVRRDFVANISHELKTPIGAITILAETIEAAADEPADVTRFAQRLQAESRRLGELVGQIIELSRLQSSNPMLATEVVEVRDVVDDALARTRASAEARGVSLIRGPAVPARILGDRWQLSDALANLVQNAVNYSDPGARVAVTVLRARQDDVDVIDIKVTDNGIGISLEDQERIFERFYRVDHGRSRESGGTGLGLSIVRHIALAHGGSVTVWSRPRQGSTFTLRLPAHVAGTVGVEEGE
ncbi:cell wall metabolism sensor histidine kinase WalK [Arachnia propionica]|uniref:Sensor-like histidine kinase SenX3 n=1 Tax=Arachnia propionica TaxID=1750 RepID=A0A3P1WPP7_9ACTN|nr:ATP-binding protein [Arachnia propionica]RRD48562.1 two-component sensor histidine kinase [Arachnia propionica]